MYISMMIEIIIHI